MANFQDFYEHTFGGINIGDVIIVYKDNEKFKGTLIFKSKDFITMQLPFYREGISVSDFFTGHAKFGIEGDDDIPVVKKDDDDIELGEC